MKQTEQDVLYKLASRKCFPGANHITMDTLLKCGWKKEKIGEVRKAVKQLLNDGYIQWYNKSKKSLQLTKEGMLII